MTAEAAPEQLAARRALTEALRLVEHGYALTPVTISRDRTSGKKSARFHGNGLTGGRYRGWRHEDAWSRDPEQIRAWWVEHPDCSFALGGAANGIEGADLDVKADVDAPTWWANRGLPLGALTQHTPSGGMHLIWRAGEGEGLPQDAGAIANGVDTRNRAGLFFAAGAYVVGIDGHPEPGHYEVVGELPKLADLAPTPEVVLGLFRGVQRPQRVADGQIVVKDREWVREATRDALRVIREHDRAVSGYRGKIQGLGLFLGRLVEAGEIDADEAENMFRNAHCAVWGPTVWPENLRTFRDALADGPRLERWRLNDRSDPYTVGGAASAIGEELAEDVEPDHDSWAPVDLGPYLDGTVEPVTPSVGVVRADGQRLLYPGLEHAIIGEMESGKSWLALACCAAELKVGNRVVYVHFEESDPRETVERLRLFLVPTDRIRADFVFLGPERRVPPGRIAELVAERPPTLVVLDGQNEAMSLHGQKIREEDGPAEFRRLLVKPWTRCGAAVVSLDHVVKDPDANGQGYAIGSVHKGNGLNGALILVENLDPFGRERNGASQVYTTKDRPGHLRKIGRPTKIARKFFLGMMYVDAEEGWGFRFEAPVPQDGPDPEFEQMREDRKRGALDEQVLAAVVELHGKGIECSTNKVRAAVTGHRAADVSDALYRLERQQRIMNDSFGRAARWGPTPETLSQMGDRHT